MNKSSISSFSQANFPATPGHLPWEQCHADAVAAGHAGGAPAPCSAQRAAATDRGVAVAGCYGEGNAQVQEAGSGLGENGNIGVYYNSDILYTLGIYIYYVLYVYE